MKGPFSTLLFLSALLPAARAFSAGKSPAATDAPAPAAETRGGYEGRIRAELDRIQDGIKAWEEKTEAKTQEARRSVSRRRETLRKKTDAAENRFSKLKKARRKDWDKVKARCEKAMKDLRKAYRDLVSG